MSYMSSKLDLCSLYASLCASVRLLMVAEQRWLVVVSKLIFHRVHTRGEYFGVCACACACVKMMSFCGV